MPAFRIHGPGVGDAALDVCGELRVWNQEGVELERETSIPGGGQVQSLAAGGGRWTEWTRGDAEGRAL